MKQDIVSIVKPKILYFAHSMLTYGSSFERQVIYRFSKKYQFINPATAIKWSGSMEPYLLAVSKSDIILAAEYNGFVGKGVYQEIKQGLYLDKTVILYKPGQLKFPVIKGLELYDPTDWKYRYGTVKVFAKYIIL